MGETLTQRRRVGEEGLRVVNPFSAGATLCFAQGNSNYQAPNPKKFPNSKHQIPNKKFWSLENWNLFGIWKLEFGIFSCGARGESTAGISGCQSRASSSGNT